VPEHRSAWANRCVFVILWQEDSLNLSHKATKFLKVKFEKTAFNISYLIGKL